MTPQYEDINKIIGDIGHQTAQDAIYQVEPKHGTGLEKQMKPMEEEGQRQTF